MPSNSFYVRTIDGRAGEWDRLFQFLASIGYKLWSDSGIVRSLGTGRVNNKKIHNSGHMLSSWSRAGTTLCRSIRWPHLGRLCSRITEYLKTMNGPDTPEFIHFPVVSHRV